MTTIHIRTIVLSARAYGNHTLLTTGCDQNQVGGVEVVPGGHRVC